MDEDSPSTAGSWATRRHRLVIAAAFLLLPIVGYADGQTSAYIAFSIFYVVPVALAAWFGGRVLGVLCAVGAAASGLAADLLSIKAAPVYAYVNLGARLSLFVVLAVAFSILRNVVDLQRRIAEDEHRLAEQQRDIRELQDRLMRQVVESVREPLGEMYAKVVDLGFQGGTLSPDEARQLLAELADATARVSRLVESLGDAPVITTRRRTV
jgi:K+-sensing histidine kinase KdpD